MFKLILVRDLIRVEPAALTAQVLASDDLLRRVVLVAIRRKYSSRVLSQLGLCVTAHELRELGEGSVAPGMGATMFACQFTLVIFVPRVGEILCASTLSSFASGLLLSTGFYQDMHVLPAQMPANSIFENGYWNWIIDGEQKLDIRLPVPLRVRIDSVVFNDVIDRAAAGDTGGPGSGANSAVAAAAAAKRRAANVAATTTTTTTTPVSNVVAIPHELMIKLKPHQIALLNDPNLSDEQRRMYIALYKGDAHTMLEWDSAVRVNAKTAPMVVYASLFYPGTGRPEWWE